MTGKSEMEEPRKQRLSIQRGVRLGSWEEEAGKARRTPVAVGVWAAPTLKGQCP